MNDGIGTEALAALQDEMNTLREQRRAAAERLGPLAAPSRRRRLRWAARRRVINARERIARRIAPWLG